MASLNRCGPEEVFGSRQFFDLLVGETVRDFPDRGFRDRVVKVGDPSRSRHSDFPLRLKTLSVSGEVDVERRTMMMMMEVSNDQATPVRAPSPHTHSSFPP